MLSSLDQLCCRQHVTSLVTCDRGRARATATAAAAATAFSAAVIVIDSDSDDDNQSVTHQQQKQHVHIKIEQHDLAGQQFPRCFNVAADERQTHTNDLGSSLLLLWKQL